MVIDFHRHFSTSWYEWWSVVLCCWSF